MSRILVIVLIILIAGILILFLCMWSPGQAKPFLDQTGQLIPGSISEKTRVLINGVEQGMFIKGKDSSRPVLLYVNGGMPEYFLTQKYPTGMENYFIVVWWEQRGTGLSSQVQASSNITTNHLVADLLAVTNYLRQRFNREKVYLLAHSGGTFIGIKAVAQAPELFYAYIGVAQIAHQLKSEKRAYDYMLQQYKLAGNQKMVHQLESAPVTLEHGASVYYYRLRDRAMHELGVGTMRVMKSVITGIFCLSWQFREYTLIEKINLWRTKAASGVSIIWNDIMSTDLNQEITGLAVPVYFMHGLFDYTCSYPEAKSYFERLKAPVKGFYTFHHSAHSPMFEEPEKMQKILDTDVVFGLIALADKNE